MNSIGSYQFIAMHNPPEPPKEDVEVIARQGVDGIAAWLTGERGHQASTRTGVDASSRSHAWELYQGYLDLIGTVVGCVYASEGMVGQGFQVLVRDVKHPPKIRAMGASSGGLNPPSTHWLEVEWELWSVAIDT
jgi:hypothetical protein